MPLAISKHRRARRALGEYLDRLVEAWDLTARLAGVDDEVLNRIVARLHDRIGGVVRGAVAVSDAAPRLNRVATAAAGEQMHRLSDELLT